jgi:hypothetical protein
MLGDQMTKFTTEIGFKGMQNPDEVGAAAVDYLRVAGHLVFGYCSPAWPRWRCARSPPAMPIPFYQAKLQTARFYFAKLFPETATLMRTARAGKVLMDTTRRWPVFTHPALPAEGQTAVPNSVFSSPWRAG